MSFFFRPDYCRDEQKHWQLAIYASQNIKQLLDDVAKSHRAPSIDAYLRQFFMSGSSRVIAAEYDESGNAIVLTFQRGTPKFRINTYSFLLAAAESCNLEVA